jgi:hypothetical protein
MWRRIGHPPTLALLPPGLRQLRGHAMTAKANFAWYLPALVARPSLMPPVRGEGILPSAQTELSVSDVNALKELHLRAPTSRIAMDYADRRRLVVAEGKRPLARSSRSTAFVTGVGARRRDGYNADDRYHVRGGRGRVAMCRRGQRPSEPRLSPIQRGAMPTAVDSRAPLVHPKLRAPSSRAN